MTATREQIQGCLLGLALGDALGAPYEGGWLERTLWRIVGTTKQGEQRWTDDTQMSIDLIESCLATGKIDPDDLAIRFAQSYRWSRGYGPGAATILKRIRNGLDWRQANRSVYPQGSFGNGAAMRAPIVGLIFADRPKQLSDAVKSSAIVTHAHPLAVEGALLVAQATASAVNGIPTRDLIEALRQHVMDHRFLSRLSIAQTWLQSMADVSSREVVRQLGNRVSAHESCMTAIYLALRFRERSFADLHRFVATCGGDVDTINAIAGAIWGTLHGVTKLPSNSLAKLEQRQRLEDLATAVHQQLEQTSITWPQVSLFNHD